MEKGQNEGGASSLPTWLKRIPDKDNQIYRRGLPRTLWTQQTQRGKIQTEGSNFMTQKLWSNQRARTAETAILTQAYLGMHFSEFSGM